MAAATQAVPEVRGYIIRRQVNEFLSRSLNWIEQPEGVMCAYVHPLEDILALDISMLRQITFMYLGVYSPETRFAKSLGLPIPTPRNFSSHDEATIRNYLEVMATKLWNNRRP